MPKYESVFKDKSEPYMVISKHFIQVPVWDKSTSPSNNNNTNINIVLNNKHLHFIVFRVSLFSMYSFTFSVYIQLLYNILFI